MILSFQIGKQNHAGNDAMVIQEGCDIMATNEIMQNERKNNFNYDERAFFAIPFEESGYVELANDTNTVAFMAGYYKLILRFYPKAGRFLLPSN